MECSAKHLSLAVLTVSCNVEFQVHVSFALTVLLADIFALEA